MRYSIHRQLTVALQNQPGRLAAICTLLAAASINIEALALIDSVEQAVIRLVTSDPPQAKAILEQQGFYVVEADVFVLDLTDSPGKLALISRAMADAQINIDFAYGSGLHVGEKTRLVVKVSSIKRACEILDALSEA
jgi:hypothetical protein